MVVRSVAVNVFENPSPGDSNWWPLYNDTTCGLLAATDNPGQVGYDNVSLDPGLRAVRRYPLGRRGSQRGTARRYASYGSPNERPSRRSSDTAMTENQLATTAAQAMSQGERRKMTSPTRAMKTQTYMGFRT